MRTVESNIKREIKTSILDKITIHNHDTSEAKLKSCFYEFRAPVGATFVNMKKSYRNDYIDSWTFNEDE